MAAAQQKEYELIFKLKAALGNNFNNTFKNAITTTKQLQGTLEKVNKSQGKIDGYKKQESALQSNKTKLEKLNTEYGKLKQEAEAAGKPTKELARKLESTERQIQKTTTKIGEQESKLASLGKELRSAGISTNNLEKENQKLQKSYERVKKAQEEIANLSGLQEKNRQAIASTKTELLKTATVVTAVGAAVYQGPVKAAAEFQEQMSTVKAISGAIPEDMTKIIAKAKQMGATTKFSATEAGKAFEYMGMAGWKADDMLKGIEGIMNLAAASGEELAIVSDIVTDAMSAFGLEAGEAGHFADVLAAASTNANTNVAMLGESFKYAAPLAGSYGFTIEDTALMLSLMANNGIKASQSGTSLRKILAGLSSSLEVVQSDGSKFVVETATMDGKMRSLKDIVDDVRVAFNGMSEAEKAAAQNSLVATAESLSISLQGENGKLKTQAELYAEVTEAMDGLTEAGKVVEAEALAGKTAMAGLLSIINTSEEDYEKLAGAIYDSKGAAEEMAKIRLDNFNGQMELAKSAISAMNIALGEALLPSLTTLIQKATVLISQFATFAEANPELVQTLFKVAGGLAAIKIASVVTKLGFLEMKGGILAAQKVFALFKGKAAAVAVESVALKGKLTAVGAGVKNYFGAVGGAMGNLINSSSILTKATAAGKGVGSKITSGVLGSFGKLTAGTGKALSKVGAVIHKSPLGKIGDIISGGVMKASGAFAPLGNVISTAFAPLGKLGGSLLGGFGGVLGKIVPIVGIISLIIAGIQLLKNNLESVRSFVQKVFGDAGLVVFDKVVSAIANIGEVVKSVFSEGNLENARNFVQNIFGEQGVAVFDGLVAIGKSLITVFQGFWNFIENNITPTLQNLFNFIVNEILPVITAKFAEWAPMIANIIEGIWSVISIVAEKIMGIINFIMPTIQSVIAGTVNAIMGVLGGAIQFFQGFINFLNGVFTGDLSGALEGIKQMFKGWGDALIAIVKAPINFLIDGINLLIRGINKIKIPDWVPSWAGGGKGINIPEIPGFKNGTPRTPDTFIAGEEGAELITNAKNRTVFKAAETANIFKNIGSLVKMASLANAKKVQMAVPMGTAATEEPKMAGIANIFKNIGSLVKMASLTSAKKVQMAVPMGTAATEEPKVAGIANIFKNIESLMNTVSLANAKKVQMAVPMGTAATEEPKMAGIANIFKNIGSLVKMASLTSAKKVQMAVPMGTAATEEPKVAGIANIFKNIESLMNTVSLASAPRVQMAMPTGTIAVDVPELRARAANTQTIKIEVNNNPTIKVDGTKPDDLEDKLKKNNQELLDQIDERVDERLRRKEDNERRSRYE